MSKADQEPERPAGSGPSPSALERIHEACRKFEAAWKQGTEPRIEDYLEGHQGPERSQLLNDLLLLEIERRMGRGETLSSDDYRSRFPDDFPRIEKALVSPAVRSSPPDSTSLAGDLACPGEIGKYKVLGELSRGGQAVVYRGVHPRLEKEVVIKLGRHPTSGVSKETHRLVSEGKLLAELEHPHIGRIYDLDFHEGLPFLVMEYARGRSLAQRAKESRFAPREAAMLTAKVARALQSAHDRGVVHLDVKPENIVLDGAGEPKLIDFGLATFRHVWGESPEMEGICGTLPYMPPEQALGREELLGPRTDLFALGAVLYFLLTGRAPYDGVDSREVLARARACDFDREALREAGTPRPLERICRRAMQADPEARQASAGRLASELEAFVRRPLMVKRALAGGAVAALLLAGWLAWPGGKAGDPVQHETGVQLMVFRLDQQTRIDRMLRLKDAVPLVGGDDGDRLQVRARAPKGLSASLFWFDSEGHLSELPAERARLSDSSELLIYPASGKEVTLAGATGTELIFLCARKSGKPSSAEVAALFREGEPLPPIPSASLLLLEADGVRWGGERGPGTVRDQPEGLQKRLEALWSGLRERYEVISGVAFPRKR
jgi:eukaryotic-like serine/threonine-protein kinase